MKQNRKISVLLVSLAAVVGIGAVTAAAVMHQPEKETPVQAVSQPKDLTVAVEGLKNDDLTGKDIQKVDSSASYFTIYDGPQMLLQEADVAVYARIEDLTYFHLRGTAWTKIDVTILDGFKGDFQTNDRISIIQYGGYIPLNQELGYLDHPERFSNFTEEEIRNTIVERSLEGAPQPTIGQTGVFFLQTSREGMGFPEGSFEIMSAYQGLYTQNESGVLERYAPSDGFYSMLKQNSPQTRSAAPDLLQNGERPYTYEQMKELLLAQ